MAEITVNHCIFFLSFCENHVLLLRVSVSPHCTVLTLMAWPFQASTSSVESSAMEPRMEKSDLYITNMTQATGAGKEKDQPASPIHRFVFYIFTLACFNPVSPMVR
jgi:hypothetical protein